ncbi:hypothetical protein BZA05DRAFT_183960 [Tricharina praecox]|uniref:uncharacterized protein n=1 Tax=Tricharina praecox TaxID=43433 RepID=UPI00221FE90C|nr:uncharacterized protein BZA05DRAFT_183960 [Tricharina praecox]KAI5843226.1 hypothetical protein BZA05DRAFT_183960 [Tricharina praecox]
MPFLQWPVIHTGESETSCSPRFLLFFFLFFFFCFFFFPASVQHPTRLLYTVGTVPSKPRIGGVGVDHLQVCVCIYVGVCVFVCVWRLFASPASPETSRSLCTSSQAPRAQSCPSGLDQGLFMLHLQSLSGPRFREYAMHN